MNNFQKTLSILSEAKEPCCSKITIEKYDGEYRVPSPDGYEDGAYYDTDKDSVIATAKKMYKNKDLEIVFRTVKSFEGGKYEKYKPNSKIKPKKLKESHGVYGSSLAKNNEEDHDETTYDVIKRLSGRKWDVVFRRAEKLETNSFTFNQALLKAYEEIVEGNSDPSEKGDWKMHNRKDDKLTEGLTGYPAFLEGYIVAAFWSSVDDDDKPLDKYHDKSDLAPETLDQMEKDCAEFYNANHALWEADKTPDVSAGHDFWLTRNGHGAGYWDGDYVNGDELTEAAQKYKAIDLYIGDDGLIYGS